jgi:hypothetical protein
MNAEVTSMDADPEQGIRTRTDESVIQISNSALAVAIQHIRAEKEVAVGRGDYVALQEWRDNENNAMAARAGLGLAKP